MNSWVILSSVSQIVMLDISTKSSLHLKSLINSFLFLISYCFFSWINYSSRVIDIDKEAWSDRLQISDDMIWLLNSSDPILRNIRSRTEFDDWELFIQHISTKLIDIDNSRPKLSMTSQSVSVYNKW